VDNLVDENVDKSPSDDPPTVLAFGVYRPATGVEDAGRRVSRVRAVVNDATVGRAVPWMRGGRLSMDSLTPANEALSADAADFVRFCYRRRRVGWPELYDEMCAVGSRGLFRGWDVAELAEHGIGFSLFAMPALATLVAQVVAEEQANQPRRAGFSIGRLGNARGRTDGQETIADKADDHEESHERRPAFVPLAAR
jgi:hypothetical protein